MPLIPFRMESSVNCSVTLSKIFVNPDLYIVHLTAEVIFADNTTIYHEKKGWQLGMPWFELTSDGLAVLITGLAGAPVSSHNLVMCVAIPTQPDTMPFVWINYCSLCRIYWLFDQYRLFVQPGNLCMKTIVDIELILK